MKTFDLDKLVSVELIDKTRAKHIVWVEAEKPTWFSKGTPEGFSVKHEFHYFGIFTKESLEKGALHDIKFIVEDKTVWYRPYVVLTFVNNDKHVERFLDYEDAKTFAMDIISRGIKVKFITDGV